jgi:hypothetical protein
MLLLQAVLIYYRGVYYHGLFDGSAAFVTISFYQLFGIQTNLWED